MSKQRTIAGIAAALAVALASPALAVVIVVDNDAGAPAVVFTGTWPVSTWSSDRIGPNYQHSNRVQGLTATYTPTLPNAGLWLVEAFWNSSADRGNDVPYTINYDGGSATVYRDQRVNGNRWNNLGAYAFDAGTAGNVVISSTVSNTQYVIADALRFSCLGTRAADGSATLSIFEDAHVRGGSNTNTNYGNDSLLQIKSMNTDLSNSRKIYLKFLAPAGFLGYDPATELTGAALFLSFADSGLGSYPEDTTAYTFSVFGIPIDSWSESSITWTNAPLNDTGSSTAMLAGATLLGTFDVMGTGAGTTVEFTSPELLDFLKASLSTVDDLVSFAVVRTTTQEQAGGYSYVHALISGEYGDEALWPKLYLMGVLIPEPASLTLLALGGLALLRRRRRP